MIDWTSPEVLALLGSNTDEAIGAELGASKSTICKHRRRAGIPAYAGNRIDHAALREAAGTDIDRVIAERFGCSIFTVISTRKKHGIPAFTVHLRRAV